MRVIQILCLAAYLPLSSCKKEIPLGYFKENELLFTKSKDEVLKFVKMNKPTLPCVIDIAFIEKKKEFISTMALIQGIGIEYVRIKGETSLYYYMKPKEHFISTTISRFSYKAKNEVRVIDETTFPISENWLYTERITNIAD